MRYVAAFSALFMLTGCDAAFNGATLVDACKPGDNVICGLDRAEDIEIIPGSRWLLISELGTPPKVGYISLVDPVTKERRVLSDTIVATETETFPRCGAPPKDLHPRGFHLSAAEDGSLRLYQNNPPRVERYRVTVNGDDVSLAWEGCVITPKELNANDIASLGDNGFVVSHTTDGQRDTMTNFKQVAFGIGTGGAFRWTRDGGWARIPGVAAAMGNGIQVDPTTGRVYLSSMFTQRILAFDADGGNFAQTDKNSNQVDNLTWSQDGRLIGVGHTGVGVYGTSACRVGAVCSFPFAVTAIDPKTLKVEQIFESKNTGIPGASSAVLKDGTLYFGSSFGDRITIAKLK